MIKISCNILTGFLGSGKTTLLQYIMHHGLQQKRVAIIMNEIGDIGIDGKVVTSLEDVESMVEFNSGCVCCTIDDYRFAIAVQQIVEETKPDLLIIETTGLADPNPIVDRLKTASVARDAVITMVDGATFLPLSAEHEVLDEQVKAADFLVLNKIDLISERERQKVEKRLRRLNRRALLLEASYGQVSTDLLFSTSVSAYRARLQPAGPADSAHAAHHAHGRDAIQAFSYETRTPVDLYAFERFLQKLPPIVYRAKGLLQLDRGASRTYSTLRAVGLISNRLPLSSDASSPPKGFLLAKTSTPIRMRSSTASRPANRRMTRKDNDSRKGRDKADHCP